MAFDWLAEKTSIGSGKKSGTGANAGFSSNTYFSDNKASAGSFMAPPVSSGPSAKTLLERRPYSSVGKLNISLLGAPTVQMPGETTPPVPFAGTPLEPVASFLGEIGKLPLPDLSAGWKDIGRSMKAYEWLRTDSTAYAQLMSAHGLQPGWEQKKDARLQYANEVIELWANSGKANAFDVQEATGFGQDVGGQIGGTLNALDVGRQRVQRGLAGFTGFGAEQRRPDRVRDFLDATDSELEDQVNLIQLRDEAKRGQMSDDDIMDALTLQGYAMTNPLGQSDWAREIRKYGFPGEVVANLSAAAVSLGLDIALDPLTYLTFGIGKAVALTEKGAASVIKTIASNAERTAMDAAIQRGVREGTDELAAIGLQASTDRLAELGALVPRNVKTTPGQMVRYALEAGDQEVRSAVPAAGGRVSQTLVQSRHIVDWVERASLVLDPLALYGKYRAGKLANRAMGLMAVSGAMGTLGKNDVAVVFQRLASAGVADDMIGTDMGTAISNIVMQVGGEQMARQGARLGIEVGGDVTDDVLNNLGLNALSKYGADISGLVKHKVDKVRDLILPLAGETVEQAIERTRQQIAATLTRAYGLTDEAAEKAVRGMSENQLGVTKFLLYGRQADDLLNARGLSKPEMAAMGLLPEDANRFIFLGYSQLGQKEAKNLLKLIRQGKANEIRAAIARYDVLEFVVSLAQDDKDLLLSTRRALEGLLEAGALPQEYPLDKLPASMKAFMDRYGGALNIALKPTEVLSYSHDADGRVTAINPFMDYIRGKEIGLHDIAPPGLVSRWHGRLLNGISGQMVANEQRRRFVQRMAADTGMTQQQSEAMLRMINSAASDVGASGPRGLTKEQIWKAIDGLVLPKNVANKLTSRQLQLAVYWAYLGTTGRTGLTQQFTGAIKYGEVRAGKTAFTGPLAEFIYPHVRFHKNPFFQLQEALESPIILTAKGFINPSKWKATFTGRMSAEERDLMYQTATMMDAYANDPRYAADVIEGTDVARWGGAAARRMASTSEGRMLTRLVETENVAGIKARSQTTAYRRYMGEQMRMMELESPEQFYAIMAHYGTNDRGEAAVRWFNDMLARNDPESAFSAIKPQNNPGEFFRPSFVGRRTRWNQNIVMEALQDGLPPGDWTWARVRSAYRSDKPKDAAYNQSWLEQTLRDRGADEDYIQRTRFRLDFDTEQEFEKALADAAPGGADEAAAAMDGLRKDAKELRIPVIEHLANMYAGSPITVDYLGNYRGNHLFQLIADASEARGLAVVARDAPELEAMRVTGDEMVADFSLSDAEKTLSWENHPSARSTELVPLSTLVTVEPGNPATRLTDAELAQLGRDIRVHGHQEPLQITYSTADSTVRLDEGNHRVKALAIRIPQEKWATTLVPVTVWTHRETVLGGTPVRGMQPDEYGYVPKTLKPSDIGLIEPERAKANLYEAQRARSVTALTDAQQKGREAVINRARRADDPSLGQAQLIPGLEGGRIVIRNSDGRVTHRIGGAKTSAEWVEEVQNTMTKDQIKEHADWYLDMRRGFLALSDNQQQQAAQLLVAFGATQLNTSPMDGMRFLLRTIEAMSTGRELPADIKALQKYAGLNAVALKKLMTDNYLGSEGFGQKLVDFIDSLLGNRARSIPVSGPKGRWGPVAGDIWAKRDAGYVDGKMLDHLKYSLGDEYTVVKERGGFTITQPDGTTFHIPKEMVGSNPNPLEYDAIVEFYNNNADYMNEVRFGDRTDWTAAEAQAIGWFKAKYAYGDATGDPRAAVYGNAYNVSVETNPSRRGTANGNLYPELPEEASNQVATQVAYPIGREAAALSGTRVTNMNGTVSVVDGRPASGVNYEVLASPEGVSDFVHALGAMGHHARVRASRAAMRKTATNRHMVELVFPGDIPRRDMLQVMKALAEDRPEVFEDAQLVTLLDGSHSIRIIAGAGESLDQFKTRVNDVELRGFYEQSVSPEGYARGRYVDEQTAEQALTRGEQLYESAGTETAPLDHYSTDPEAVLDEVVDALLADDWGGYTIDLKTGKKPKPHGEKKGGGPYASAITPGSTTLPRIPKYETRFHGTRFYFDQFDNQKFDPYGLYGPGVYLTDSPKIATGYAETTGSRYGAEDTDRGWVRRVQLPDNLVVFDAEEVFPPSVLRGFHARTRQLEADVKSQTNVHDIQDATELLTAWQDFVYYAEFDSGVGGGNIGLPYLEALRAAAELSPIESGAHMGMVKTMINEVLQEDGYQALTHVGGRITGSPEHVVHVVFDSANTKIISDHKQVPTTLREGALSETDQWLVDQGIQMPGAKPFVPLKEGEARDFNSDFGGAMAVEQWAADTGFLLEPTTDQADSLYRYYGTGSYGISQVIHRQDAGLASHDVVRYKQDIANIKSLMQPMPEAVVVYRAGRLPGMGSPEYHSVMVGDVVQDPGFATFDVAESSRSQSSPYMYVIELDAGTPAYVHRGTPEEGNLIVDGDVRYVVTNVEEKTTGQTVVYLRTEALTTREQIRQELAGFIEANRGMLERSDTYLGVFDNLDTRSVEFDVNMLVDEFEDAEALQLVTGRQGGAYDFTTGDGVYRPYLNPHRAHGVRRGFADVIEASNDWNANPNGEGYIEALRGGGNAGAAGELERDGVHWGRMVYEDAHQRVAPRELDSFRARRRVSGEPGYEPGAAAGYLDASPRGTRAVGLALADSRRDTALFQRSPGGAGGAGAPRGVITDPGTSRLDGEPGAQITVSRRRRRKDTYAHEHAHDVINRRLDPSGKRRAKGVFAGREGAPPQTGRKSRATNLTVDEQEWLADQLVEYLRLGEDAVVAPGLKPLAGYYSKNLRTRSTRAKLDPEAKRMFDELGAQPAPRNAYNYDVDEQNLLEWMHVAHRRADRMSRDLVHFKTERSWLERSLNHPYFGLYPLSYMWGKVLPEMVEFLAFRPFGQKAPLVGAVQTYRMYQHVMQALANDEELRDFMAKNEAAFRAIGMLMPGLPWELPVNTPNWLRRYVEAAATNVAKDRAGDTPEDLDLWHDFVGGIDTARIVGDTIGYAFGPRQGTETVLEYPGLVADIGRQALGIPEEGDPTLTDNNFIAPTTDAAAEAAALQAQQASPPEQGAAPVPPTGLPPTPTPEPVRQMAEEGSVEDIQQRLLEEEGNLEDLLGG